MDISRSTNMSFGNKSLNGKKRKEEILKLMNFDIDNNKIVYIDNIEKENDDKVNDNQEKDELE